MEKSRHCADGRILKEIRHEAAVKSLLISFASRVYCFNNFVENVKLGM